MGIPAPAHSLHRGPGMAGEVSASSESPGGSEHPPPCGNTPTKRNKPAQVRFTSGPQPGPSSHQQQPRAGASVISMGSASALSILLDGGGEGKVFCPWATHFDATPRSSLGRGGDLALDEWSQLCKIWGKRSSRQQGKHVQRPWGVVRHGNPEDQQRKPGVRCGQTTGLTREGGEESGLHSSHSGSTLRRKIWRGPHTGG